MHKYFHHILRGRALVIYDFAPDPSEFPNIGGKFSFLFYQCILLAVELSYKATTVKDFLQFSMFTSIYYREDAVQKSINQNIFWIPRHFTRTSTKRHCP